MDLGTKAAIIATALIMLGICLSIRSMYLNRHTLLPNFHENKVAFFLCIAFILALAGVLDCFLIFIVPVL